MVPRYARLGGWLLLAGVVGAVVACSTPAVDGDVDNTSQGATKKSTSKKSTKATDDDDDDDDIVRRPASTSTGSAATATPTTTTTATPTVTGTATSTATTPTATTTATTPPPVTQPNCRNDADPGACLDCCLASNPGATSFENSYDDCLDAAQSQAQADNCKSTHLDQCAANTSCTANHACMEANNCLQPMGCAP